jgi:hypothetical protein
MKATNVGHWREQNEVLVGQTPLVRKPNNSLETPAVFHVYTYIYVLRIGNSSPFNFTPK